LTVLIGILGLFVGLALVAWLLVVLHRSRITPVSILKRTMMDEIEAIGIQIGEALIPPMREMCRILEDVGRMVVGAKYD
jgi:hypothetical protein